MRLFRKYMGGMLLVALGLLLVLAACEKDNINMATFDDQTITPNPVISAILPEGGAVGGVNEITIRGENFPALVKDVAVYVDGAPAIVTATSASEIIIRRPNVSGEALTITVACKNALRPVSKSPYKITAVQGPYGTLAPAEIVSSYDVDVNENLFVCLKGKQVVKLAPDGSRSEFATTKYPATDVKIGPQGLLYTFLGQAQVYRIEAPGTESVKWVSVGKKVGYGDYDANGYLYTAGKKTDIITVRPDESSFAAGKYADFNITSMRVYNQAVYTIAEYAGEDSLVPAIAIWKNEISATGQLGDSQLVLDWATVTTDEAATLNCLTFAQNGDMYIGANLPDPVLILRTNGILEPLYPGILTPSAANLVWGEGNYLYANVKDDAGATSLIRIDVGQRGAPCYGRKM